MNRGIYGLSTQAVNGLGSLQPPGQSVGVYARLIPWLTGVQNSETTTSIAFTPRPYVVIGTDPTVVVNNGNQQYTGLALQLPTLSSAFITVPAFPDSNYATQNFVTGVGAARGQSAVDVQTYRTSSSQVASGQFATAVGIANTASGSNSTALGNANAASVSQGVALGYGNAASTNTNSVAIGGSNSSTGAGVACGVGNTSTGTSATAVGVSATASSTFTVAVGYTNTANTVQSSAIGVYATTPFSYVLALSAGRFVSSGDSQLMFARQVYQTTTATATQLFGDNTIGTNRLNIAASTSYAYKLQLVARQTGGTAGTAGDTAVWNIEGGVYRAAAGNAVLLGATTTSYSAVTAAAAWTATVSADTTNQALVVTVAGEANKNINWVAFWQLVRSA